MIDKKMTRGVSVGALAALLSGCGHLPIAEPTFEALTTKRAGMPADWTVAQMTGDSAAVVADYSVFQDSQLIAFVQEALENNRTLRAAIESVRQSEASLQQTRSRLFPQIGASIGANATDGGALNSSISDVGYSFAQIMGALNVDPQDFRDVDRALQSLRRRGLVTFTRAGGWVVVKKESA